MAAILSITIQSFRISFSTTQMTSLKALKTAVLSICFQFLYPSIAIQMGFYLESTKYETLKQKDAPFIVSLCELESNFQPTNHTGIVYESLQNTCGAKKYVCFKCCLSSLVLVEFLFVSKQKFTSSQCQTQTSIDGNPWHRFQVSAVWLSARGGSFVQTRN